MEERLQKVMSNCGVASRRASEKMILEGRVRVNGVIVRELGTKVDPDKDRIAVDGKTLEAQPKHYYLFNKPKGVITTSSDDQGRATVMDYFRKEKDRIYAVGRLDQNTEGLLIMTNDANWPISSCIPAASSTRRMKSRSKGALPIRSCSTWLTASN